ncbi:MAG: hypothetical protein HQL55_03985 [Magnetococcales bacterium]|nr:hypothetical protein [Magnetococcales bacterium]
MARQGSGVNPAGVRFTSRIFIAFIAWAGLISWYTYFLVYPDLSGFLTFIEYNNATTHPRFSFYDADDHIKALFVVFLRVVIPVCIVMTHSKGKTASRHLLVFFAALLAMQSVERQNLIVLLFVLIMSGLYFKAIKEYILDVVITLAALVFVFVMQGNISVSDDSNIAGAAAGVLFTRVMVDPFYMSSYIYETYDGPLLYGASNRIFVLFDSYEVGWSAIGILPDLYINFGLMGYMFGAIYFALLLGYASQQLNLIRGRIINIFCYLLYLIALVGLYFSNTFSLVPAALYLFSTMVIKGTRMKFA